MLKQVIIIGAVWSLLSLSSIISATPNFPTTIEAIIFDCDGVLIDTEGLKFQAWQRVLSQFDVKNVDRHQ